MTTLESILILITAVSTTLYCLMFSFDFFGKNRLYIKTDHAQPSENYPELYEITVLIYPRASETSITQISSPNALLIPATFEPDEYGQRLPTPLHNEGSKSLHCCINLPPVSISSSPKPFTFFAKELTAVSSMCIRIHITSTLFSTTQKRRVNIDNTKMWQHKVK